MCRHAGLGAAALLVVASASYARADETLKFHEVVHIVSAQSQDIGDVEGHATSLVRFSGLALLADGAVGTVYFIAATDYIKGAGSFSLYHNLTLEDGSVLWFKTAGTAKPDGAKTQFSGTVTVLGGKGRFEGAKGDGTEAGTRYGPIATGADLYNDFTVNIKK